MRRRDLAATSVGHATHNMNPEPGGLVVYVWGEADKNATPSAARDRTVRVELSERAALNLAYNLVHRFGLDPSVRGVREKQRWIPTGRTETATCVLCNREVHRAEYQEEGWSAWQNAYGRDWCKSNPADLGPHIVKGDDGG